jgi:hypothetical protein
MELAECWRARCRSAPFADRSAHRRWRGHVKAILVDDLTGG